MDCAGDAVREFAATSPRHVTASNLWAKHTFRQTRAKMMKLPVGSAPHTLDLEWPSSVSSTALFCPDESSRYNGNVRQFVSWAHSWIVDLRSSADA